MKYDFEQSDKAFFGHPKPLQTLFLQSFGKDFLIMESDPYSFLYMIAMVNDGGLALDRPTAAAIVGLFAGSMYLMTVFGVVADNWLAKHVLSGTVQLLLP